MQFQSEMIPLILIEKMVRFFQMFKTNQLIFEEGESLVIFSQPAKTQMTFFELSIDYFGNGRNSQTSEGVLVGWADFLSSGINAITY